MAKYDAGAGLSGAASGAVTGGTIGSVIPGIGTAIGGGIGAVAGGLLGFFSSKKKKPKKISTLDKTQQPLYNDFAQGIQGQGQFADLFKFDPQQSTDVFNKNVAQPAYQNFQENIVPSITGQFRGGNLQNSSYLGGALGKAGTDVQRGLDAQLARMLQEGQQSSIDRRLGSLNNILNMQTFAYQKPQRSPLEGAINGFSGAAGDYAGKNFMNMFNQPGAAPTP